MTLERALLATVSAAEPPAWTDLAGARVPQRFSSLEDEVRAIRASVALSVLPHVSAVRVGGEGAYDVLDRACPAEIVVRDARMRQTLLLRDDGSPLADIYLCTDDDTFFVFGEGTAPGELAEYLRAHVAPGEDASIEDLRATHDVLSLNGPFAPELLAALEGPEILGFPYLTLAHLSGDRTYFRGGKTGEFGFDMLVPSASAGELWQALTEAGAAYDLRHAGVDALFHASLENWFFCIFREGRAPGITPLELGLQWRLSPTKSFPGSAALAERRARGVARRATAILADDPSITLTEGDTIFFDDRPIGAVIRAERSVTLDRSIGIGLIELAYAHSGVDRYRAGPARQPIRTVSAPFINNLSLYVNPTKHTYERRSEIAFPGAASAPSIRSGNTKTRRASSEPKSSGV